MAGYRASSLRLSPAKRSQPPLLSRSHMSQIVDATKLVRWSGKRRQDQEKLILPRCQFELGDGTQPKIVLPSLHPRSQPLYTRLLSRSRMSQIVDATKKVAQAVRQEAAGPRLVNLAAMSSRVGSLHQFAHPQTPLTKTQQQRENFRNISRKNKYFNEVRFGSSALALCNYRARNRSQFD